MSGQLNITNATYGRNQWNDLNLTNAYSSAISQMVRTIGTSSTNYSNLVNTVSEYWSGVDATEFKSKLTKLTDEVVKYLYDCQNIINTAISESSKKFGEQQSKIKSNVQSNIKI